MLKMGSRWVLRWYVSPVAFRWVLSSVFGTPESRGLNIFELSRVVYTHNRFAANSDMVRTPVAGAKPCGRLTAKI